MPPPRLTCGLASVQPEHRHRGRRGYLARDLRRAALPRGVGLREHAALWPGRSGALFPAKGQRATAAKRLAGMKAAG